VIETYRGTVYRWEVDSNDHLTVAYYFARLADAERGLLGAIGLVGGARRARSRCITADCYVRYQHELRAGDLLHIESGVISVGRDALVLGHKVFDSGTGDLCTTIEQRVRHVNARRQGVAFTAGQRRTAEARRVRWDGPPRELRPRPQGLEGFRASARDTVKPWEGDVTGEVALQFYIHRFSAANGHALAAFGMTPAYMRTERRGFSTFEFQLQLDGALRVGDPVRVSSALLHVGNSSMRFLHVMIDERTGKPVASLEQSGVHLDMDARKSTPLPPALRERALAILVAPAH